MMKTFRRTLGHPRVGLVALITAAIIVAGRGSGWLPLQAQNNPIVVENLLPGTTDNWDVQGAGDPSIQGFADDISVSSGPGQTVSFKIKLTAPAAGYTIDIYRLGYYQGLGARKVGTVTPTAAQLNAARTQPACNSSQFATSGLVDCGNWGVSGTFATTGLTSGIFIAKPTRTDTGGASHIVFMVRDDTRTADILFQASDTTWQAYNQYPGVGTGGASMYCGGPVSNAGTAYGCAGRATKVSYNRPFDTRAHNATSWLFNAEYPMLRFLEANGYDVKYWAGVDTDRRGADLVGLHKPKTFLSVGHDEYWSGDQRRAAENARNAGVSLAFFSGNEMFWKTRYEPSVDGLNTGYRTLVSYKETLAGRKIDPAVDASGTPIWTGTWRDPRFSPPGDGGRPENGLIGQIWTVNTGTTAITVPASMAGMRLWRNTRVADLTTGVATLSPESLGYEWDEDLDNGARPAGIIHLSATTVPNVEKIIDYGSTVGIGTATHNLTLYRHNSGALVFGAGTVQWSWGLDGTHDLGSPAAHVPDQAMQQATVNLLADMGAQPGSLQTGADPARPLTGTSPSSDIFAPTSVITSPPNGGQVENGNRVTISGTATELGGGVVASVEVSVDGGTTWRVAEGTTTWSFDWSPGVLGSATIRTRAVDDSGNVESPSGGTTVAVVVGVCPCPSLWKPSTVPTNPSAADTNPYELGVKFKSDIDGFITGIRFYKGPANSGTHLGHLWSSGGAMLAEATFTNETSTGWQQVLFAMPVAITANTTYVASYHTNVGGYAFDGAYFASAGVDSPPLHALPSSTSGGNGVFSPGGVAFPSSTFNANNYWVDVVFAPSLTDSVPPIVSGIKSTTLDSSRVTVTWATDEQTTTRIDYGTNPAILTATLATLPAGTVTRTGSTFVSQHTMALTGLQPNTTYYYLVTAVDQSGNTTTVAAPTFTVPGPTLRDTASTDFAAGTGTATYVSQTADGEVILLPTSGSEFTGPGLPSGWIVTAWSPEGYSTIQDGVLLVDGARVATCVTDVAGVCVPGETTTGTPSAVFTAPHSLEFSARFSGDQFQHAGLAVTFGSASEPWAIFSTLSGGLLFARTNTGAGAIDTPLGTGLLGAFHHYRIDWKPASVDYYVDGALLVSHALTVAGPMRPVAASDFNPFGGNVFVDWMRMSSYAAAGSFDSRVFDATSSVNWSSIQWTAKAAAGTTVGISVRTGDTPIPDGTWSAFAPVASPGPLALFSRYIQYRAAMTSNDPARTPSLDDIIISTGHAPVAVADATVVPQSGSYTFPAAGPGSLTFNDTDVDSVNALLRVVAVTPPAHGSAVLNADGSVKYTPTPIYNGPDAFTYTVSDGLLTSSAVVTLDVRFGNIAPVSVNDFYNTNEETTLTVPVAAGILANDTDVERDPLTAVLVTLPAHGMLTLSPNGAFVYAPALNYAGPDTFTYRANDTTENGNIATVQIMVNQVNDAPITEADSFTAVLNQSLDVPAPGVLRNDHDVEVEDTTPMHAALVSGTSHGQLTFRTDGSFSYVADADYLGLDSFTYRAIDHFNAPGNVVAVTLTVAIKAVSQVVTGGATVSTGDGVTAADPLSSAVTSPLSGTVSIAQGVISASRSPAGYTFLNQQVNITITAADGTEVIAPAANPIRMVFTIDRSLIPASQDHLTFQMFRNGVLIPNCLGATAIPAANFDPCVTARENLNPDVRLSIITSHASHWNMGILTTAVGDGPVALNDGPYAVDFQTPLVVMAAGVLGNDYGPSSLTAVLTPGSAIGGTVDLASSGGFTFTPTAGLCGPASFQYKAHDGTTESNEGTVSLRIDCTPHAGDDATTVLEDSGASTITVLANDTDPDPSQTLAVIAVSQGSHGAVAIAGSGLAVSYAPQPDFFGTDTFSYTVSDGHNGSATATVTMTVTAVNDAPSFTNGASQTVAEDAGPQSLAGFATNHSAGPANESAQAVSFLVSNGNNGLFSAQPAIAADGTLTYTPAANANGSAAVSVQVRDDGGTSNGGVDTSAALSFVITVTPVNDAPVSVNGAVNTDEDTTAAGTLNASDVDLDALVYTIVANGTRGTAAITNPATGAFTYTPNLNASGPDSFTFKVNDGTVDSAIATVAVTIGAVNDVPVANGGSLAVSEDTPKTGTLTAGDVEGDPLVYSVVTNGTKGVVTITNTSTGDYSYAPGADATGPDSFTFRVFDGTDYSGAATVTVSIASINDAPGFTKGADQTVSEDSGPAMVAGWATSLSAGPADESGQELTFVVGSSNAALFSTQPAIAANGTLTFTPAANAFGTATVTVQAQDNGGTTGGGSDTGASQTFTITVNAVNDVPSFVEGANQTFVGSVPAQTLAGWATGIGAGPANELDQALNFIVTSSNPALFSVQPAIAANGTLTFTPAANVFATATVTVQLHDDGGVTNGGVDTSAAQTFTITIAKASTATVVTSTSTPSLFGVPVTLTATVGVLAPGLGVPAGSVTFKNGAITIGTAALSGGTASITTSTLSVATHAITAVYAGNASFQGSTSPALSQVISASAKVKVTFAVHALQDSTNRPKVKTLPVPNALVKVFKTGAGCTGNLLSIINPKKWGVIFDGADGVGGIDGCDPVTVGGYEAVGTTDVNGVVTIIVPTLTPSLSSQYLVIARATNFDYVKTVGTPDPLYSQYPVINLPANAIKNVPLSMLATFAGKIVPGAQTEFFGSYLNIIQPEYVEWTEDVEEYPIVMVAQGDWSLVTSVTPPEGFVPDVPVLGAQVADATTAVQFTMTDVGSEWTETIVNHSIVHLGETKSATSTIPMIDRKATMARNDNRKVMHDSGATALDLLVNDKVNHLRKPLAITAITPALNGTAVLAPGGLSVSYTPAPGYSGVDTFTYTITDAIGGTSTATVSVTVLATPEVSVRAATLTEGDTGIVPGSVNLVLSNQSLLPVTVSYATADGTATAGSDYVAASGTVTFEPGTTSRPIALQAMGDTLAEPNENLTVSLGGATNATIAASSGGLITIADDDPPEIWIPATVSVREGNAGSDNVAIVLTLSQSHDISVWVNFATAPGTALAGSDYIHTTGTVQFFPGTTSKAIFIPVLHDAIGEGTESFYVDLNTPLNSTLTTASRATVTIVNDDASSFVTSTSEEFGAGAFEGGAYLAATSDGEITLQPEAGGEFLGSSLPAGWTSTAVEAGGTSIVAGGAAVVDGAALRAPVTYVAGRTLEFNATFRNVPDQSIGFANATTPVSPMAMFVIKADRQLYARSVNGTKVVESPMAGVNWLNKPLTYRIVWNAGNVQYFVNGALMITHSSMAWGAAAMRPTAIDGHVGGGAIALDWMRMTPYATAGTYTSAVMDAGEVVQQWLKLTASSSAGAGTTLALTYRTGDTATPDASWSSFTAPGTGGVIAGSSRYIQFRIQETSTNVAKTPIASDVTITYMR